MDRYPQITKIGERHPQRAGGPGLIRVCVNTTEHNVILITKLFEYIHLPRWFLGTLPWST